MLDTHSVQQQNMNEYCFFLAIAVYLFVLQPPHTETQRNILSFFQFVKMTSFLKTGALIKEKKKNRLFDDDKPKLSITHQHKSL